MKVKNVMDYDLEITCCKNDVIPITSDHFSKKVLCLLDMIAL